MNEEKYLIEEYISSDECDNDFNCELCEEYDFCYMKANERCNLEFAKSIDYGGLTTDEEFWEGIFD